MDGGAGSLVGRRILMVDPDTRLAKQYADYLAGYGYDVRTAASAAAMERILSVHRIEAVVLEVMLPDTSGLSAFQRLAQGGGPAVIFLTTVNDEADRIVGLEIGADDYLSKPLSPRELLARLRAVLRRRQIRPGFTERQAAAGANGVQLDFVKLRLHAPPNLSLGLTRTELTLVATLLDQPGRTVSRTELLSQLGPGLNERVMDTQVSRLRRKLHAQLHLDVIRTVRGVGYAWILEGEAPTGPPVPEWSLGADLPAA